MRVPFIVHPSHHSYQHANQTLRRATPISIRNNPSGFGYHTKCFDDTLYFQQPSTFVKKIYDDDVAQIFINTLEKNIKEIYKNLSYQNVL